jgi:hypothetical protein
MEAYMSYRKFAVPMIVAASVLIVAGATVVSGHAQSRLTAQPVHMLTTSSGLSVRQTTDGRHLYAHVITPGGAVPLHGTHQLTNGGQITVQQGHIIADSHGAVQAIRNGSFNPSG